MMAIGTKRTMEKRKSLSGLETASLMEAGKSCGYGGRCVKISVAYIGDSFTLMHGVSGRSIAGPCMKSVRMICRQSPKFHSLTLGPMQW